MVKFIDERGGFCTEILVFFNDLLAKFASLKMGLLQADGKLVSFVLIVNFSDDIEFLNLLSGIHLNFHRSSNQRCILQNFFTARY